ncbi:MAG TPA: CYTH and CHAD domain-containing protein [Acidimicrobiia bacterium]|nr:CYTH and CHAD domain-containing protein [Acidimicrobiia bacterium]
MAKTEREVKLAAWGGFVLPALDDLGPDVSVEPLKAKKLDATYYDTRDLRLARAGVSLRHRVGDDPPWTVKLPDDDSGPAMSRREITFAGPAGTIPAPAAALVRAYARGEPLVPVARLKTERSRLALSVDGRAVAEIADDEVSVYHGRRLASRFREIEVEVEDEAPGGLLPAVVKRLRAAGAGAPDKTPKVVRALGPRALEPLPGAVVAVGADSTVGDVVQAAIANALARIVAHDPGVRLGDDAEDVHQARVGTRRLRSDLRTFRPLLDAEWVAGVREAAGWFAGLLGEVRDADVLMERLEHQAATLPGEDASAAAPIVARLGRERDSARERLLEAMDGPRYIALLDLLTEAAQQPRLADPGADGAAHGAAAGSGERAADALPPLVRRPWRRLAKAVAALPEVPADQELHAVRILAKHTRYAAEAAAGVIGKPAAAFAKQIAAVQTVLGDHQDACVTEDWLRRAAGKTRSTREAMLIGQLIGLQRAEAGAKRAEWPEVWRRASDRSLRGWLG